MHTARLALAELMPSQDVLIQVLDARMPASSHNPLVAELWGTRPCIKVLTKSDLADPDVTRAWFRKLETPAGPEQSVVYAFASSTERLGETRARITELSNRLAGGVVKLCAR